ncbi:MULTISPECIES: hypothetical protein [Acetobacter]|uniref:Uncharacterized protein n=1 Tax=Acetobacter ascendens TaxID=481146 RepID=A0A1Y0V8W0_9PROT|nr:MULTISPECIES: hypothetical protein [Acetobacter]ARW12108.1 hypothetical protein S101447_03071 [Acetobacter ascendens]KAA8388722.1 hypothetical protein FKW31_00055 [Acetobacter sp. DmW_136]RCL04798.1 hypothetical protein BBA71_11875 [Acetobacter pasteurianus]
MSESGLGSFGAFMLGQISAESSAAFQQQVAILRNRGRSAANEDYNRVLKLALRGEEVAKFLDKKLDTLKAELATEREKSAALEEQLATANEANAELQRRLEAEKAHAVMLDDRLFDLTMRHAKLCKQTGTTETSST